jgi:hypothetical protein
MPYPTVTAPRLLRLDSRRRIFMARTCKKQRTKFDDVLDSRALSTRSLGVYTLIKSGSKDLSKCHRSGFDRCVGGAIFSGWLWKAHSSCERDI